MTEKDHIIWSDKNLDYDEWREFLDEEYPELSVDEKTQKMYEINDEYLLDERANLNIQLSQKILVIADLGLWSGRKSGFKEIQSGNIKDCLYSDSDYNTWYLDEMGDLRCEAIHHDGTNHYLYRVFKDGVSDEKIADLELKIYNGEATKKDIDKVTNRLGDKIAKVYGFEVKPEARKAELMR